MKTTEARFKIGTRVRPSGYAIKPKRDYWLGCGRWEQKSAAKQCLDDEIAKRGTVTEVNGAKIRVAWDSGAESYCLDYMVEAAL